ncbi:amidohydrolase family protein [Desertivirga xinjiangensis]|uniref:amidohydrolase family protein n=1 Tax=Desertivirga xinjiangensis TaxID=539206 RepID=UPI00210EA296|nr:amidohydrolase family protein [Pedobacter xinjiangensis]
MQRIDSHQHFWRFDPIRDSWINDEMSVIQRDFLPEDLSPVLKENKFDGCVAVQADQSEEQNAFLLELAAENSFIKGIVGWIDLRSENIVESLQFYKGYEMIKGFRHVLQGEADRALMLNSEFKRGIKALGNEGYTYDILIFPDQLIYVPEFVSSFPDQKFVIDHIAKPPIKGQKIEDWARDIRTLAQYEHVFCKVSGMVTEADWKNWRKEDFNPYLDVIFETFGSERLMYGSDWPVCLVAAEYKNMLSIVSDYTSALSENEQNLFWGGNASRFYGLD